VNQLFTNPATNQACHVVTCVKAQSVSKINAIITPLIVVISVGVSWGVSTFSRENRSALLKLELFYILKQINIIDDV
jgi:hypothetical protein